MGACRPVGSPRSYPGNAEQRRAEVVVHLEVEGEFRLADRARDGANRLETLGRDVAPSGVGQGLEANDACSVEIREPRDRGAREHRLGPTGQGRLAADSHESRLTEPAGAVGTGSPSSRPPSLPPPNQRTLSIGFRPCERIQSATAAESTEASKLPFSGCSAGARITCSLDPSIFARTIRWSPNSFRTRATTSWRLLGRAAAWSVPVGTATTTTPAAATAKTAASAARRFMCETLLRENEAVVRLAHARPLPESLV